jgi:transcriptional regulator with XRE-family HTH domain
MLHQARLLAGATQRELAERTGVAQPAIARIERGAVIPRMDTLDRLLEGCGFELRLATRLGAGVDRSAIQALLRLTPLQRLRRAVKEARNLERLERTS